MITRAQVEAACAKGGMKGSDLRTAVDAYMAAKPGAEYLRVAGFVQVHHTCR